MTSPTPGQRVVRPDCHCYSCNVGKVTATGMPYTVAVFIICPRCGNKRCPKATDHKLACTYSNEPGQPGSRYT